MLILLLDSYLRTRLNFRTSPPSPLLPQTHVHIKGSIQLYSLIYHCSIYLSHAYLKDSNGCPEKNGPQTNGCNFMNFNVIKLKIHELNIKVLNDKLS